FKFHEMVCKHIFAIYQKYYLAPTSQSTSDKVEKEPEKIKAIKKVWDWHSQEDRNQLANSDLELIVKAENLMLS
ncbi:13575_t:CDS:2, partial [Gigaspora margarita]